MEETREKKGNCDPQTQSAVQHKATDLTPRVRGERGKAQRDEVGVRVSARANKEERFGGTERRGVGRGRRKKEDEEERNKER